MAPPPTTDPSLVGRPVFFVRPPAVVQADLLAAVIRQEYSASILADHTRLDDLLALHPQAVVFINVDEGYTESEWEGHIRKIRADKNTQDVKMGVVSQHPNPDLAHKYVLELDLPCGYTKLGVATNDGIQAILAALEGLHARGRRRYLRVPCRPGWASLNFVDRSRPVTGSVVEISSVGLSCVFDEDPGYRARTRITGVQLKLKGVLCTVTVVVMGSRPQDEGPLYVLIFDPFMGEVTRDKIRSYQRRTLQALLEAELEKG